MGTTSNSGAKGKRCGGCERCLRRLVQLCHHVDATESNVIQVFSELCRQALRQRRDTVIIVDHDFQERGGAEVANHSLQVRMCTAVPPCDHHSKNEALREAEALECDSKEGEQGLVGAHLSCARRAALELSPHLPW